MPSPRRRVARPGCPFCFEELPLPRLLDHVYSLDEVWGGSCSGCGAGFVVDETGKSGGQALLDLLSLLAGGDLQRALALREGVDYQLKTVPWRGTVRRFGGRAAGQALMQPKAWVGRLLAGRSEPDGG